MPIAPYSAASTPRYWAVVPAAGAGRRMGGPTPKQYLPLHGRTVLEHSLARLAACIRIEGTVVALGADDDYWPEVAARLGAQVSTGVTTVTGGAERCHSVLNALEALAEQAAAEDWVLVHDAARPCIRPADVERLCETLANHPVGGLLGLPVSDTMKRADAAGTILETVAREGLWRALTPQMFRLGPLREALRGALAAGVLVTDEAAAMEWAGSPGRLVEGHPDNIKITHPHDLALAELYLARQEQEGSAG